MFKSEFQVLVTHPGIKFHLCHLPGCANKIGLVQPPYKIGVIMKNTIHKM